MHPNATKTVVTFTCGVATVATTTKNGCTMIKLDKLRASTVNAWTMVAITKMEVKFKCTAVTRVMSMKIANGQ